MSHLRRRRTPRLMAVLALAVAMLLAACSGNTQSVGSNSGGDDKSVTIGYVPFDEVIAVSYLWKNMLEKQGYQVEMQQLEVATVYQGVANSQLDVFFGGVPITHKDYWDRFGKDFTSIRQWYDTLLQGIAVPNYSGLKTLSDLEGKASTFGGQIVGIEAGSGLMRQTSQDATKTYDLSGYKIIDGSTPAMLAALDKAIKAKKNIAVTLWTPHWAFERYPITMLQDDKKAYPGNDTYKTVVSKDFAGNSAVVDQWKTFHMTEQQLATLMLKITDAGQGKEDTAVQGWITENQAAVDGWAAKK
ncbi:glycine betaine ABC transporter substrate-binding protein [Kribbella sp. NPDC050124]|uniref:glycine betaine ABC transporter substrate-binding protein n=1 Tax=Kribbella sp. NPDC050124 TaxID=3364114 RepID=UPI00379FD937